MCMHIFRQITIYIVPLISIENKCLYDAIQDLKCEKKKFGERRDWIEPGSIASKRQNETQFIICTTGADVYIDCSSSRSSYTSWLTDVSSSQRGVIYSYIYMSMAAAALWSHVPSKYRESKTRPAAEVRCCNCSKSAARAMMTTHFILIGQIL